MALALYRKYRPATFAEVVGQEHVTEPLRVALSAKRVNHAYLFSGPRGCGKTSSARILARSLNCEQGPTPDPCGVCESCIGLAPEGPGTVDVVELDAASHGGVDDARELRDRAFYAPAQSRYRVFIVDEAHMVTTQGFNALLKIVEEPPEHLVFIFATTEPEKVLGTIRSRTHHYPFRLIPPGAMRELLERNVAAEGVTVERSVFPLVIRAGGGSARDTQSVLDQLLAGAGPDGVTYERAVALLGVTDVALIDDMVDALAANDHATVYGTVDRLVEAGHDPRRFAADLLDRLRDLVLLRAVPDAGARGLVSAPADELARMQAQSERIGPATLSRYAEVVNTGLTEMRGATAPRLLLELLCARMLLPAAVPVDPAAESAVLQRLEQLERRVTAAPGQAAPAARPAQPTPAPQEAPPSQPQAAPPPQQSPAPQQTQAPQPTQSKQTYTRRSEQAPEPPAREPVRPASPPPAATERPAPASPPAEPQSVPQQAEPQPEPQSQPSPAGTMDAAAIRRVWPEIERYVREHSKPTLALLMNATVQSVEGNTLVLSMPTEPLARQLSGESRVRVLREALMHAVGGEWSVQCVAGGRPALAAPPPATPQPARPAPTRPSQRQAPAPEQQARQAEQPPPPEPPDDFPDVPPPPEPEDEDEMMAQAAREPVGEPGPARDPEKEMLELLANQLGAKPLDGK
ncbi:DNA polymerase III subunit gamma and tau [Labedaea rhizosphaerae]|uniref:DNA polymerase III subunit gamma and tau n=1 Tax=Labedaea rhizosphaerae TaxID=598644 RepID=UPI00105D0A40|nr:DNA polymerase III subunit gamma and tau [Labedaea rhizosphaerae]